MDEETQHPNMFGLAKCQLSPQSYRTLWAFLENTQKVERTKSALRFVVGENVP
jgi:tRNA(Glu) U13 pseudouridine synthase TruD